MSDFEYSIVIRTLGKAGDKYRALLDSIKSLTIQPKEVIVVLPEGYIPPDDKIGTEYFVYSRKGMVQQRVYGAEQATSKYILFLDDDVSFEPEFVEKMAEPILSSMCDVSVPPQLGMLPPKHGIRKLIPAIELSAVPTIFNKNMYIKILKSGGWSYNCLGTNTSKYLYTESAAGIGFLSTKEAFMHIRFENESWLEDTKYALPDDQVMFYKYHIMGHKIICVTDVVFTHLDAGGNSSSRAYDAAYAMGRNKYIFWYKFIYEKQENVIKKSICILLLNYSFTMQKIYLMISGKRTEAKQFRKGHKDGKYYVKRR